VGRWVGREGGREGGREREYKRPKAHEYSQYKKNVDAWHQVGARIFK
jgi:hypothetical protein